MRRSLAFAASLALVFPCVARAGDDDSFRPLGFAAACEAAKAEGKCVLVDFYTTWCGPCRMLDETTWRDPSVRKWIDANAVAIRVDAEVETALAEKFFIFAYPSILFVRANGEEFDRLIGYRIATVFVSEAKDAVAGNDSLARQKKKVDAAPDDPMRHLEYGRALAARGKQREALDEYLWCFDHGLERSPTFAGVRTSFLVLDIATLGRRYAPAREALVERREATAMASHSIESDVALRATRELKSIDRMLVVAGTTDLDELQPSIEARQYAEACARIEDVPGRVRSILADLRSLTRERVLDERQCSAAALRQARWFEALLGARRTDDATQVMNLLIEHDASGAMRAALIRGATRAGDLATARAIALKALRELSGVDRETVAAAADAIPADAH